VRRPSSREVFFDVHLFVKELGLLLDFVYVWELMMMVEENYPMAARPPNEDRPQARAQERQGRDGVRRPSSRKVFFDVRVFDNELGLPQDLIYGEEVMVDLMMAMDGLDWEGCRWTALYEVGSRAKKRLLALTPLQNLLEPYLWVPMPVG
jgi:hypothetical protein